MGWPPPNPRFTVDDYLAMEREADERHIYLDGEIYAMAGERPELGFISMNIGGLLHSQLRGKPCGVLAKDTKVRSGPTPLSGKSAKGLFSYPDVLVVCDELEFHDAFRDVIINPTMIAEVLSESTEAFDRGEKFNRYRQWNPTLRDYLLVSQNRPRIEYFSRQPDGSWSYHCYEGLDKQVVIASIQCELKLADVYERIKLPEE